MLIREELIQRSRKRFGFDLKQLEQKLGDRNRSRWMTVEQKEERLKSLYEQTGSPLRARVALERIIQGNDLTSINYLARGTQASRPVCRVQLLLAIIRKRIFLNMRPGGQGEPLKFEAKVVEVAVG